MPCNAGPHPCPPAGPPTSSKGRIQATSLPLAMRQRSGNHGAQRPPPPREKEGAGDRAAHAPSGPQGNTGGAPAPAPAPAARALSRMLCEGPRGQGAPPGLLRERRSQDPSLLHTSVSRGCFEDQPLPQEAHPPRRFSPPQRPKTFQGDPRPHKARPPLRKPGSRVLPTGHVASGSHHVGADTARDPLRPARACARESRGTC